MAELLAQSSDETQILENRESRRVASMRKLDSMQTVVQLREGRQRSNKGGAALLYRKNLSNDAPYISSKATHHHFVAFTKHLHLVDLRNRKFPPYSVLRAHAITLQLILGDAAVATASPPVRALLASSGQHTVGTLLPDNVSALPSRSRSTVDCIVLARAVAHMEHSILVQQPTATDPELGGGTLLLEEDLLWVMYVEWTDGIAERRGIGQILVSALVNAVAPGPKLQVVLLG